ncbi:MAG: DUF58 domain-containing protein [Planctomycetes bacterium]|jgi:uncharacterized protein (DUF58 family)|nr:DUF58 domain-containing protein [Planctomycetota bacterium]MBT6452629.1 DUF58 domain-containing protein [Planctomycetota bacterium]MBT6542274.1 DUF58 domain-containing protein [Planctomycetota bacterium]MBT6783749.1 DUF58 domain-containing protein [Planctomycetota bacterium]MBT6968773.1 DUF58 domain-containing protein [Planctomycetota bacterium]
MSSEETQRLLDPASLAKVSGLIVRARMIVEGSITGLHRSPFHGSSVEFAEHREYVPGDDIRHIDWKVFGRSDRFYIKQYEEETNLRVQLVLDASESMTYGSGAMTKLDYARTLAASLAYLILGQQDAVGALVFDDKIRAEAPISQSRSHLQDMVSVLAQQSGQDATDIGEVLGRVSDRLKRRCLIVLLSDLFDDQDRLVHGLRRLRHAGHDVLVLHIMDPDELNFPFNRMTLFEGLEDMPAQLADPDAVREAYLVEIRDFMKRLRRDFRNSGIQYQLADCSKGFDQVLREALVRRVGGKR